MVSWTAPASNGGLTIIRDKVTSSGGQKVTTPGTTRSVTLVELTNCTTYTFTVSATNARSTSPASVASNAVIPNDFRPSSSMVFFPLPLPISPLGSATVLLGGNRVKYEFTRNRDRDSITLSNNGRRVIFGAQPSTEVKMSLDSAGTPNLAVGRSFTSSGSGFSPDSEAESYLMNQRTATSLGKSNVSGNGK